jgi:GT2 family glycosyltransferase
VPACVGGSDVRPLELAAIILNWNAAPTTVHCIRAVASWKQVHTTIWVVDNDSTDGSAEIIPRECPNIHLIHNPTNLGFAGGNNQGIVQALHAGDVPILLLNNDASIGEEDVIRLMSTLQADERLGIIGPLLFDGDGQSGLLSAGGRDIARHVISHNRQVTAGEPVCLVDYVPGTVMVVRPAVFRTVGLFDEDYFFGGEVADLCERAREHGYLSAVDTRARAFHFLSHSSGLRETLHIYYVFRNRFLFISKFYGNTRILLYAFWALYGLGMSLKARLCGKPAKARAIRLGLLDGLQGRFGGQNERVLSALSGAVGRAGLRQR